MAKSENEFLDKKNNMSDDKPIAYDAYQQLADAYAELVDVKPHNAYYERPAMLSLLPDVNKQHILDAGCGPGAYAEALLRRGASTVSFDASDNMLEKAAQRLADRAPEIDPLKCEFKQLDMTKPLDMFDDDTFDGVNAPLCLDYVEDWRKLFLEFARVVKPGGWILFSCGHPASDAEYFNTEQYFSVERVSATWKGFGIHINMPSYRRSLTEILSPMIEAGFAIDKIHEPLPTEAFKRSDAYRYKLLLQRPVFLCVRGRLPS